MSETVVSVALSDELCARVDRYRDYLSRMNPGVPMSRGAVIQVLIHRCLDALEEEEMPDPDRERLRLRLQRAPYRKA